MSDGMFEGYPGTGGFYSDNRSCYNPAHWDALRLHDEDYPDKTYQCDNCDKWFCEDHGQVGGDRQIQEVGAVAYPSICDACIQKQELMASWALNRNHYCEAIDVSHSEQQDAIPCGDETVRCPRCLTQADTCQRHLAEVGPLDNRSYVCWSCAVEIEDKHGAEAPIFGRISYEQNLLPLYRKHAQKR